MKNYLESPINYWQGCVISGNQVYLKAISSQCSHFISPENTKNRGIKSEHWPEMG